MPQTIARRVFLSLIFNSLATVCVLSTIVWFAFEDFELTMLELDRDEEATYFLGNTQADQPLDWQTPNLRAVYIPDRLAATRPLPPPFDTLPYPYHGETEWQGRVLDVQSGAHLEGRYYFSKDISNYERREVYFSVLLAIVTILVILLSVLFSVLVSQRVVRPLKALTTEINSLHPGQPTQLLKTGYVEQELVDISHAVNRFSATFDAFYQREKALLTLASHELRTPIAVISGAAEVLERELTPSQQRPFARLKRATAEMGENINGLLSLSRHDSEYQIVAIEGPRLVQSVRDDLNELTADANQRIAIVGAPAPYRCDAVLLKMLLKNLIHNALKHTRGPVTVYLEPERIRVEDRGAGLSPTDVERLANSSAGTPPLAGLGLYIVTLICERMGLRLEVLTTETDGATGTTVVIDFPSVASA